MKWLTNLHKSEAWGEGHRDWMEGKCVGNPRASDSVGVAELIEGDMVGVYVKEEGDLEEEP